MSDKYLDERDIQFHDTVILHKNIVKGGVIEIGWEWLGDSDYFLATRELWDSKGAACPWPLEVIGYYALTHSVLLRRTSHEATEHEVDGVRHKVWDGEPTVQQAWPANWMEAWPT
jgi:hypothetical protein